MRPLNGQPFVKLQGTKPFLFSRVFCRSAEKNELAVEPLKAAVPPVRVESLYDILVIPM